MSKYYQIELGDVMEYLHRKGLLYRETASHLIVKECPFCHKPTMDKVKAKSIHPPTSLPTQPLSSVHLFPSLSPNYPPTHPPTRQLCTGG